MANKTSIEWTDYNWNFLRGCSRVSEGCRNCYAEGIAARFSGPGMAYEGLAKMVNHDARWTGEISFHEDILIQALRWKQPRRVFVNSMSDLFHDKVSDEILNKAFAVMALTPQHTYQILTKRPERMREYLSGSNLVGGTEGRRWRVDQAICEFDNFHSVNGWAPDWPLRNVWLGVSVEDQKTADERIPWLLQTPAAVRWISAEPLLGPIDIIQSFPALGCSNYFDKDEETGEILADGAGLADINWIVVGGESGHGARPLHTSWLHSLIRQFRGADIPIFVKQLGSNYQDPENGIAGCQTVVAEEYGSLHLRLKSRKGGDINEWPEHLRIREFPSIAVKL
jgi:protein gp37